MLLLKSQLPFYKETWATMLNGKRRPQAQPLNTSHRWPQTYHVEKKNHSADTSQSRESWEIINYCCFLNHCSGEVYKATKDLLKYKPCLKFPWLQDSSRHPDVWPRTLGENFLALGILPKSPKNEIWRCLHSLLETEKISPSDLEQKRKTLKSWGIRKSC